MSFPDTNELTAITRKAVENNTESDYVEFKDARSGMPRELWKSISAFSNNPEGGIVIFGVAEDISKRTFKVVNGLTLAPLQERIISCIRDEMRNCGEYNLKLFQYQDKDLLALIIKGTPIERKPCYRITEGMPRGAYIRTGNTNRQISEEELRSFLRYSPEYKHDRLPVKGEDSNILDRKKVASFLAKSATQAGRRFSARTSNKKVLKNLGLVVEMGSKTMPTIAGYLIFSKGLPQDYNAFERYIVRCVRYAGSSPSAPIIDQQDVYGTLDMQIDEVQKFILRNIAVKARVRGTRREDYYEYPDEAIREIIANAVIHRDYMITGTYVNVSIYSDRLEVTNPGTLPPGITIENLKASQFSRNEVIANVMRGLNYMEEFGRGIDLIYARMSEYGLIEPLFKNSSNSFKVTLLGEHFKALNERQVSIWHYLQDNNQINIQNAVKLFPDVSRPTVNNDLRGMVRMGLISVKGASSSTYYEPKY